MKSELNTILASGEIFSVHQGKTIDAAIKNIDKRAEADKSMYVLFKFYSPVKSLFHRINGKPQSGLPLHQSAKVPSGDKCPQCIQGNACETCNPTAG